MYTRLKIWPEHFDAVANGIKTCELRIEDDKTFAVGDTLALMEWDPRLTNEDPDGLARPGRYTHRSCKVAVTHILRHGDIGAIPEGWALLSVRVIA